MRRHSSAINGRYGASWRTISNILGKKCWISSEQSRSMNSARRAIRRLLFEESCRHGSLRFSMLVALSGPAFCSDRNGGGGVCRTGDRPLIRYLGLGLSLCRPLLRRTCIDASSGRERLYLRLCHHGRIHRLDHRLRLAPGVCLWRLHGSRRMVRLFL